MTAGKGRSITCATMLALLASPVAFAARAQDSTAAAQRAAEGHIEPGDRVAVKVYLEPSLSDEVLVNTHGDIVLARLGAIHVTPIAVLSSVMRLGASIGPCVTEVGKFQSISSQ